MTLVVEVAPHFQQAACGVPALTLVAPGTGRNVDQPAAVDPDFAAGQLAAVAVVQGIAQFVALHLDLDIVALHRHLHAHCAGHVHARGIVHVATGRRIGDDLAARGNRQRIRAEMDVATRDDLHPRLVPAIIVLGQIVEGCRTRASADRVLLGRAAQLQPTDYVVDEKSKSATLSEFGIRRVEKILNIGNLYEESFETIHYIENAIKAQTLFHKDKDYVIKDGEIIIVDEFTGRLMQGRRWSDGLHQAVEAKEDVKVQQESQTWATILGFTKNYPV